MKEEEELMMVKREWGQSKGRDVGKFTKAKDLWESLLEMY